MIEDLTPQQEAARAIGEFDRALSGPARAADPIGDLFMGLATAFAEIDKEARRRKEERRNTPEAKARRSVAAKKAAATRAAKKAAELAARQAEEERDARVPTVHCPHIDFVPYGGGETECIGKPGHKDDHEDVDGHTWPNDCDGTCEGVCEC